MQTWCFAEDLETAELAGMESVNFLFGPVREHTYSVLLSE